MRRLEVETAIDQRTPLCLGGGGDIGIVAELREFIPHRGNPNPPPLTALRFTKSGEVRTIAPDGREFTVPCRYLTTIPSPEPQ